MLPGHANRFSNVYLCVESLVPLRFGQHILSESVESKLLAVHRCERILLLRMAQDSLFNQPIEGQRVIISADDVPLCVMLHFILYQLCVLSKNQLEPLSSMLFQISISLSVGAPLIAELSLLLVSHNNENVHIHFVVTLCNLVLQNC